MELNFKQLTEGCSAEDNDITRRFKKETEFCSSVDKQINTYLPEYDTSAPYQEDKCNAGSANYPRRGESLHYSSGAHVCAFP